MTKVMISNVAHLRCFAPLPTEQFTCPSQQIPTTVQMRMSRLTRCLRWPSPSPSPSPSPDRAASELSGATLADVECGRGGTVPPKETSGAPAPEDMLEGEVAGDQDTCRITSGPRIRLRVSQPRITLRLKSQDTSPRRRIKRRVRRNRRPLSRIGREDGRVRDDRFVVREVGRPIASPPG